ncbi:P-loop NTPase fold protein [Psychrobacter sp. M13]|uniref:KAP family P-loop NTPase fold protein n=1 Tax=Psychrobacter sp. M13 TaxID=3067275 RepID=UPI00273B71F5|nr:P-loop NTPase fold protein [Psychrobacter sp. M13]WLP94083.1 P-loop NTPase fold protein [Psychrobacter sp. M13]
MRVKPPKFIIDKDNPFANDLLNREDFADNLTNIIVANKDELVVALDGQWGEGKTTFINMWQTKLESEGFPCIYIDAFKIDYTDDAFVPIAFEIDDFIKNKLGAKDERREEFFEKTVEVSKRLLIWTGKVGLKALTLNAVGEAEIESLSRVTDDISEDISEQFNRFAEEKFLSHHNTKGLFENYRIVLSKIAAAVNQSEKPLIIIIDELDRCRPKFAVQILEKIKHFFSVENVVFVLSVNQEQLEHSIKAEYGIGIDSNTYLQKFIDIKATLPRFNITENSDSMSEYQRNLFKSYEIIEQLKYVDHHMILFELIACLLSENKISYRQSERVMLNVKILVSSFRVNSLHYINLLLIAFVAYIVTVRPNIIENIYTNKVSYSELTEINDIKNIEGGYLQSNIDDLKLYIGYCFRDKKEANTDENFCTFYNMTHMERKINSNPLLGLVEILNSFSYLK